MKIALMGYGKMGKAIEQIALEKGHQIVAKMEVNDTADSVRKALEGADVAIEFTRPESALENLKRCFETRTPVVCGTTGWLEHFEEAQKQCEAHRAGFFYASNFSIGVNIFFEINRQLAAMMALQPAYEPHLHEIHHTQKLDAPSGTGITLAQGILEAMERKTHWVNRPAERPEELALTSARLDQVPGTHLVTYDSPIDCIEIKHTAHSREGFARGAVMAAEWLVGKTGCFGMRDLLGF